MANGKAKYHEHKVGLGEAGDTAMEIRGRPQDVRNFLQGGGKRNITVWFGDLGPFGGNEEEGRRIIHGFSQTDHRESSIVNSRRDMGDAQGRSSAGSGVKAVGNDLYRETTRNCGAVGCVVTNV